MALKNSVAFGSVVVLWSELLDGGREWDGTLVCYKLVFQHGIHLKDHLLLQMPVLTTFCTFTQKDTFSCFWDKAVCLFLSTSFGMQHSFEAVGYTYYSQDSFSYAKCLVIGDLHPMSSISPHGFDAMRCKPAAITLGIAHLETSRALLHLLL